MVTEALSPLANLIFVGGDGRTKIKMTYNVHVLVLWYCVQAMHVFRYKPMYKSSIKLIPRNITYCPLSFIFVTILNAGICKQCMSEISPFQY